MIPKPKSIQKNDILFEALKSPADKFPNIIRPFFESLIVSGCDRQFEKTSLRNELEFYIPFFFSSPIDSPVDEIDNFKKFLDLLKQKKIVETFEIKPLSTEKTKKLVEHHPHYKNMLGLVDNGELEYWNFKISLSNKTERLEALQKFYDSHIVDRKSEAYSLKKQCVLTAKYLLQKSSSFGKGDISLNLFTITKADTDSLITKDYNDDSEFLSQNNAKHIRLMATLRELENLRYIEIENVIYNDKAIPLIVDIKLSREQYKKLAQYHNENLPKNDNKKPSDSKSKKNSTERSSYELVVDLGKNSEWEMITMTMLDAYKFKMARGLEVPCELDFQKIGYTKTTNGGKIKGKKFLEDFLLALAINNGVYQVKGLNYQKKAIIHTRKKEAKKALKESFGFKTDPFKWNEEKEEYAARFKIVPPSKQRVIRGKDFLTDKEIKKADKFADWEDDYRQNAPQI